REEEARPHRLVLRLAAPIAGEAEVRGQVRIARNQASRALVCEDGPPDVAGAEVGVAEVEVQVAALVAGGEHALVRRRRVGVALLAVERVALEEERVGTLAGGDGEARAREHGEQPDGRERAPEAALALEAPDERLGATEDALHVAAVAAGREARLL